MRHTRRVGLACLVLGVLAVGGATPALAIQAGITLQIHQDIVNPELWPNDFHIEGLICSHGGTVPTVLAHIDGPFPFFTYNIYPLPGGEECWYWFEATWWAPQGIYIPYCTVIHLGILFDVDDANVIIDLVGWWTRDGIPVGEMGRSLHNQGYVPLVGFNVADVGSPQIVTIANGDVPITPPLPPPSPPLPPWPPAPMELWVVQMDVVPFPPGMPPNFHELHEFGEQQSYPWVPVVYADGAPISPERPYFMPPDSFFDIFLDVPMRNGLRPEQPFTIEPGGFLVARQLVGFYNNAGEQEFRWFWEIHGAQLPEACCFPDGHCEDLVPFTCLQKGGLPMGQGTFCAATICPATDLGACCYGDLNVLCAITDPVTCQDQLNGVWKGPGTNCDDLNGNGVADICEEPQDFGACCYGEVAVLCVLTDAVTCQQLYNGVWMGPGTNCADLDGNGIADICEGLLPEPQACCLPDGMCVMLLPPDCLNMGGQPMGPYTRCLGDLNGNGIDDICEAKWIQMPDLSPNGMDVDASIPLVLADDFLCVERGAITDFIVWGSWYQDMLPGDPLNVQFTLSIHEDIPQGPGGYSMPGQVLWLHVFPPGSFAALPYEAGLLEGWYDPAQGFYQFPGDTICWQYFFHVPPQVAFCQKGSPDDPKVYWLDVQAEPMGGPAATRFGWKTSPQHWNDKAVWGIGPEPYPGPWFELRYPPAHPLQGQPIDLAFALGSQSLCYCKGDMNCDGVVNFGDINPFVLYLSNPVSWHVMFPDCPPENGDINGDGQVSFADINPFVALMVNSPIPCP